MNNLEHLNYWKPNWLETKGNVVTITFAAGSETFTAGGSKRYVIEEYSTSPSCGTIMVNGLIRFADTSLAYCLLKISEVDSGELLSVGVFLPKGTIVYSGDADFLCLLGRSREEVFPFTYKCTGPVNCDDMHVGPSGWSIPPQKHKQKGILEDAQIGGLSFREICPGTNADRLHLLYRQFPGSAQGYRELLACAKVMGVRTLTDLNILTMFALHTMLYFYAPVVWYAADPDPIVATQNNCPTTPGQSRVWIPEIRSKNCGRHRASLVLFFPTRETWKHTQC